MCTSYFFIRFLSFLLLFFWQIKLPACLIIYVIIILKKISIHFISKKKYPYILSVNLSYRSYRTRIKDRSVDCLFMHSFATYFDMFALGHARNPRQTISNRSTIHRSWIAIASMFSKRYQYSKQLVVFPDQETCSALDIRSLERDIELGSP